MHFGLVSTYSWISLYFIGRDSMTLCRPNWSSMDGWLCLQLLSFWCFQLLIIAGLSLEPTHWYFPSRLDQILFPSSLSHSWGPLRCLIRMEDIRKEGHIEWLRSTTNRPVHHIWVLIKFREPCKAVFQQQMTWDEYHWGWSVILQNQSI